MLHFLPTLADFLAEVARILRPGGMLYFDVLNFDALNPAAAAAAPPDWGYATTARLRFNLHRSDRVVAALRDHGFEPVKSCPFCFVDEIFQSEGATGVFRFHFQGYLARKIG